MVPQHDGIRRKGTTRNIVSAGFSTFPREINGAVFPNAENAKQLLKTHSFITQYTYLSLYKPHNGQMSQHSRAHPAIP
jgi:hypothetical protein